MHLEKPVIFKHHGRWTYRAVGRRGGWLRPTWQVERLNAQAAHWCYAENKKLYEASK